MKLIPIADVPIPSVEILARDEAGSIYINPDIKGLNHYYLCMENNVSGTPSVTIPANSQVRVVFTNSREAHLEISKFTYKSDGDFLVEIRDEGAGRAIMNRPLHVQTMVGDGQTPAILPATLILDPSRSLYVTFIDRSGADNEVWFYFSGTRYYYQGALTSKKVKILEGSRKQINAFFYTTDADVTIPAGLNQVAGRITISEEHAFVLHKITAVAFDAGGTPQDFLWKGRELNTGRSLSNSWLHSAACFGNGKFPYILPQKMLLERSTGLDMDFRNISAASPEITIYMTLWGKALYPPSSVELTTLRQR